ncbi:fluoride efflux transporter CrcB [Clostridium akagii]|uniref:fluoride efflux transporter CrcB n=1 Tax=Clostridium akagii TaxID=91623 RepID=UPI00047B1AFE|nr:fluoride efflux transporter CrcB [Clostridium akagii]
MEYILVGIGGIFGSVTRYSIGKVTSKKWNCSFPVGTFIINITGAMLLGIVSSAVKNNMLHSFLGDGILGGYTTFSTFMYEGFNLFKGKKQLNAFNYIVLSIILGVAFYGIGANIGGLI